MTHLTIYALAHDSNSTEDVYISLHDKVKLYIKLADSTGKALVQRSVSNFKQAKTALQCYNITDVDISYNVDVTDSINKLAHKIYLHYLK